MEKDSYQELIKEYRNNKYDSTLGKLIMYCSNRIVAYDEIAPITSISEQINTKLSNIYNESVKRNKEIGGIFLEIEDGSLIEERCITGEKDSVKITENDFVNKLSKNIKTIIRYHTHPDKKNFPSSDDVNSLVNLQMAIDAFYEKMVPVVEVIAGKNGLRWYKFNIN